MMIGRISSIELSEAVYRNVLPAGFAGSPVKIQIAKAYIEFGEYVTIGELAYGGTLWIEGVVDVRNGVVGVRLGDAVFRLGDTVNIAVSN